MAPFLFPPRPRSETSRRRAGAVTSVLPACWLLLWTLTAPVGCIPGSEIEVSEIEGSEIEVTETPDGIKLSCTDKYQLQGGDGRSVDSLDYRDENTGEYRCVRRDGGEEPEGAKIYVKFRTCDNCIELDLASITGIVVGDVVATLLIGVTVYLIAAQSRSAAVTALKKSSDRQHLVLNETTQAPNDHYQTLLGRQRDTYDVLNRQARAQVEP
ncbi:T-cell surface glycoprotein CD3 delta chain-like [Pseudoliparis swirei]|uniref:T-cell surface glycoprotein CD3 delta chain-like n=1 Tax=Pseudoliparis swirei TaxID=2059687 RepID=UPI0024BEB023|nr:T-cell surface glycoprotein CD3 delta chain-like [Pseudoliparis swirei]